MGPAPEGLLTLTVADLFHPDGNVWDVEKIRQILPFEEDKILSLRPSLTGAPDKLIWLKDVSGTYSTKTGYIAALATQPEPIVATQTDQEFDWKKNVWKLQTAPKIQLFAWKVFHGAIPCGEQLLRRHIIVKGTCKRCGSLETIEHLFLHCEFSKQVWMSAPVQPCIEYTDETDLRNVWNRSAADDAYPHLELQ